MRLSKAGTAMTAVMLVAAVSADHHLPGITGSVKVVNYCPAPVFLNSVGNSDGRTFTLQTGESWSERYKEKEGGGGPSIKIRQKDTSIIQLEYNPGKTVWYNLSYVNCWNQQTRSGTSCPFWNQSFVLESPSFNIPCKAGAECPYPYRCPRDDNAAMSIIDGPPISTLDDATQDLTLHLCPCEGDPESEACKLALSPGRPPIGDHSERMKTLNECPNRPYDEIVNSQGSSPSIPSFPSPEDPWVAEYPDDTEESWGTWDEWQQQQRQWPGLPEDYDDALAIWERLLPKYGPEGSEPAPKDPEELLAEFRERFGEKLLARYV